MASTLAIVYAVLAVCSLFVNISFGDVQLPWLARMIFGPFILVFTGAILLIVGTIIASPCLLVYFLLFLL